MQTRRLSPPLRERLRISLPERFAEGMRVITTLVR